METIEIRSVRLSDAESIAELHTAAVMGSAASHYPIEILNSWASDNSSEKIQKIRTAIVSPDEIMIVATIKEEVIGFGSIVPRENELRAVYVHPNFGRKGIGGMLYKRLEELAKEHHLKYLKMDASINAEAFYKKQGFAVIEKSIHTLDTEQEMECVRMRKDLQSTA